MQYKYKQVVKILKDLHCTQTRQVTVYIMRVYI